MMIPPQTIPARYTIHEIRNTVFVDAPHLVSGRVPFGIWSVAAPPGHYKSTLLSQIMQHVAYGVPLPGLEWEFIEYGDCLHISVDESAYDIQDRNLLISPFGSLTSDGSPHHGGNAVHVIHDPEGNDLTERIKWLQVTIEEIEQHRGRRIVFVTWDTLGQFLGVPEGRNAYEHAEPLQALNQWCTATRRVLALPNHIGKDGRPIGTVAIDGYSNLSTIIDMYDDQGVLSPVKMRGGAKWQVALEARDGILSFSDKSPHQMRHLPGTQPRAVLDALEAAGELSTAALADVLSISPNRLRPVLMRLHDKGEVQRTGYDGGRSAVWQLAPTAEPRLDTSSWSTCRACELPIMPAGDDGSGLHMMCEEPRPTLRLVDNAVTSGNAETPASVTSVTGVACVASVASVAPPEGETDQGNPDNESSDGHTAYNGLKVMQASIAGSRMHPIGYIPKDERDRAPWGPEGEWGGARAFDVGMHQYVAPDLDPHALCVLLDRNGSFPSACSSVAVAANRLVHTGPDVELKDRAGMIGIICPEWTDPRMPHPLGRRARPGAKMIVTSGAVEHLAKLAAAGVMEPTELWDSWTGKKTASLFERFYTRVKQDRETYRDDSQMYAAVKQGSSKAIRLLYPTSARSPFWRPDWYAAISSEARRRHWIRAYQAVELGATLVALCAEDEVAFLLPDGAPPEWMPSPYKPGIGFGEMKSKPLRIPAKKLELMAEYLDPGLIPHGSEVEIYPPFPVGILTIMRKNVTQ